ncbi:hypothetical protein [Spongiivirga citrea]|uniref:Choice-of-anchor D domain-containing protein n=1 Tax=Spongiivirga citrea TaxID=1481457 RepID=A0A6M0CLA1_9FLAO|nr:hypothetical protein [Spongiivirga citrea]NER16784.1 hypothetical protein [Spongiivirga citrea]
MKSNQRIILSYLTFISLLPLKAQDSNKYIADIVPPSPMAYEITRFEAQQPDLYTGTASVNIPLHTIDFDGWQLPMTLNYHASGIQTNQEATEAGLGWALNATAVISRQVRGINDFQQSNNYKGHIYNTLDYNDKLLNWSSLSENEKTSISLGINGNFIDTEPDIFNYNFFGFSGSFSLSRKEVTNDVIEVIKHDVDGVEIIFNEGDPQSRGDEDFEIITPTGFKGIFRIKERSTNMSGSGDKGINLDDNGNLIDFQTIINRGNFRVVTGWYLEKIISPKGKEIYFSYNISPNQNSEHLSVTTPAFGEERLPSLLNVFSNGASFFYPGTGNKVSFSRQIHEHVYQQSITVPGEVEITFTMEDREDIKKNDLYLNQFVNIFPQQLQDVKKPKRYTNITIQGLNTASTFTKNIELGQSYFNYDKLYENSNLYSQYQYLRSRLDYIKIDDQRHNFEYAEGLNGLPRKSTLAVDHFGYYSGKDGNNALYPPINGYNLLLNSALQYSPNENRISWGDVINCDVYTQLPNSLYYVQRQDRKPNVDYGIAGALVKVQYPTRGYSTFEYESQEYYATGRGQSQLFLVPEAINYNGESGNVKAGGLRIASIQTRDENDQLVSKKSYSYTSTINFSSGRLMTPMLYLQDTSADNSMFWFEVVTNNGAPSLCLKAFHYQLSIPGSNTAGGKRIGYSKVIETIESTQTNENYKVFYEFENTPAEFLGNPPKVLLKSKLNSKPISRIDTDKNGTVKQLTEYQKSSNSDGFVDAVGYTNLLYDFGAGIQESQGSVPVTKLFLTPLTPYTTPIETVNISQTKTTQYFDSGNLTATSDYEFNTKNQLISEQSINSKGEVVKSVYKRLSDFGNAPCTYDTSGQICMRDYMNSKNIIDLIMEQITYVNDIAVSAMGYKYDVEEGNVILRAIYTYDKSQGNFTGSSNGFDFTIGYELKVTYDKYDGEGNVLQYTIADGLKSSFIWGYDNEYPIVKGDGISHANLLVAYNSASNQGTNYEQVIREHPNTINAFVSTYKFNPLTGLTESKDPAGRSTHYTYDEFRRLIGIKDLNLKLVQELKYKYADILKSGGLTSASVLPFGVVNSNTSREAYIKLTNTGNYGITINDLQLPTNFSSPWDNQIIFIPQGSSFNLPITFNAPSTTGNFGGTLLIKSDDINGDLAITLNASAGVETRDLTINPDCYIIDIEFGYVEVALVNSGNSPLYVANIVSDDNCITNEWQQLVLTPEYEIVPYVIPANSTKLVKVQLECPLNTNANWDARSQLTVRYSENYSDFSKYLSFQVVRYETYCPDPPPTGPAFTVTGDTDADCSTGMAGSIIVNRGAIRVVNNSNQISGPSFGGTTIDLGAINLNPGASIILTPPSYPFTYNFNSSPADCSNGFGTSQIQVYPN